MANTVTLTATSLEGQVIEIMRELQQAEDAYIAEGQALTPPQQRARRLTVTPNFTSNTIGYSVTLPVTVTDNANGYTVVANPYLP